MVKETSQPKAVNIIRPTGNINYSLSLSSSGSTASNGSQQLRRTTSNHSSTVSTNRKPRVVNNTNSTLEKPTLNLYHPPTRKPSYDNSITRSRPPIELYKPQQQPQRLTKSFTAPSLSLNDQPQKNTYSRPVSPSYFRPQQQQQQQSTQHHRSVLGVINTPAINSSADNITDKVSLSSNESVESSDQEIDEDDDTSDKDENDEDDEEEDEEEEEEDDEVNEARVNRKIADLELSINSLLTVNAMLESTVRKQASQLNQIKKQQLSGEPINDIAIHHQHVQEESRNEQSDDEEDWENDEAFQRLKKLTEFMIEEGQKSIDFEYKILGRVLSNYEEQEQSTKDSSIESIPIKKQKSIPRSSPLAKK